MTTEEKCRLGESRKQIVKQGIADGKSLKQIAIENNLSKGIVYYHSSDKQKKSWDDRQNIKRKCKDCPFTNKLRAFIHKKPSDKNQSHLRYKIKSKLCRFFGRNINFTKEVKMYEMLKTLMEKLKDNPVCYLTGEKIDIYDTKSYNFDHIIPASRGGKNTLENLGVCTKDANAAKFDKTPEEFMELCKKVLQHNGYEIVKKP